MRHGSSLRRHLRAHGHQRAVAGRARSRSFIDESHGTSARTTIGSDEHFILITCQRACSCTAGDADSPNRIFTRRTCGSCSTGRTGRTGLAFLTSRAGWSRRPWFPLLTGWTCSACFSFWSLGALTAARRAERERNYESNASRSHAVPQFFCACRDKPFYARIVNPGSSSR
jgi:hypothetical protein